ncbi:DNA-binding transcriptional regulator YhcF, GntR family [Actinokineospora alba]|uniref:DNA-binding transcriptional regulator YhcF, GntR family n=1 Tax=Actinokineospora alba TaxID=504798 RepID=A0A1H0UB62_9PSEU|nr:GntR family transcriptional regulator [Actinokineospora alba]TDP65234.1 GntR family transcriptional regulator [Actinokineospora alba]SDH57452.1 DNA-binding transcriptional regulator YhcF, GntR family [Actinokineospora alba]SDP63086.1 DNA-binding transcriptional regulator YhcF, GntR family [Actinokineospora alba]
MITIDPNSAVPPFEQVRGGLAQQINDHTLAVGTKLPTVRQLATDLGLAANTVARAYRELEEAGLVETRGRAGTFVGAAGDRTLERARKAADTYAEAMHKLGLDHDTALSIAEAALTARG